MPASHRFDERHLQDVVLAQSGQIRAGKRFSGLEMLARPVVALTAIVAIVAIALGIKDYVQPQKANPLASPDASTVAHPKAITRPKKTERTRMSAAEATAAEAADAQQEKPLISGENADPGTERSIVMGYRPNNVTAPAARDGRETALDRDHETTKESGVSAKPAACLPLPNGTQPGDVDAPYYFGWATEYCGSDLKHPSTPPKVPESPQPKR